SNRNIIDSCEKTLVCMDQNGVLLSRIWCLYEIWNTIQTPGVIQQGKLILIAHGIDYNSLEEFFINCDVEKAQAKKKSDINRILNDIKKSCGFSTINNVIRNGLVESAKYQYLQAEKKDVILNKA